MTEQDDARAWADAVLDRVERDAQVGTQRGRLMPQVYPLWVLAAANGEAPADLVVGWLVREDGSSSPLIPGFLLTDDDDGPLIFGTTPEDVISKYRRRS